MKSLQKFVLPLLIVVVIAMIYLFYFKPDNRLGSFSTFDTNNSAVKDIKVKVLVERGINSNSFYVSDNDGTVVLVQADKIPDGIQNSETIVLRGHLNKESFHAHEILLN
ncbi:MAG: hypothetical protein COW08_04845 [Ignavibacteriales bacterium CG12_big_fil_rev_8_21_14_0_65_30_8]|nr:MAG: hypothetical protein COW08_04845 [Ignavibacteriales bacterium CG12_big_fil_rev_8_21_14_0_65_30_8]